MNRRKIIVSPHSGFCFGVKRALEIASSALEREREVYSLGPIIHNPQVVDEFYKRGLKIINDIKKIRSVRSAVLIPSHGISPKALKRKGISYIDTTCPLVRNVQKIVRDLKKKGYFIIIAGDRNIRR